MIDYADLRSRSVLARDHPTLGVALIPTPEQVIELLDVIAEVAEYHAPNRFGVCRHCAMPHPCRTARIIDAHTTGSLWRTFEQEDTDA